MLSHLQLFPIREQEALAVQQGERHRGKIQISEGALAKCHTNRAWFKIPVQQPIHACGKWVWASTQPWRTPASILNHELWVPSVRTISLVVSKQGGGEMFFGQFVCDIASVTCVIYNCPIKCGRAIHQWILFITPTQGHHCCCRLLMCDKLRRSAKWSCVTIQQWKTRYSSRIVSFSYTPAFDTAVNFNSFEQAR